MKMPLDRKLLERPAVEVFEDRHALDRVIRAVCLERGDDDYLGAVTLLERGVNYGRELGRGSQTLGQVLAEVGLQADSIGRGVKVLDARDNALKIQLENDLAQVVAEPVNAMGQVMLAPDADYGKLLANPEEAERRLARMRRADPRGEYGMWEGEDGRQRFQAADRQHIEAGVDLVRCAERPREVAEARARQAETAERLDRAIDDARIREAGLKALDTRIAELAGEASGLATRRQAATGGAIMKILLDTDTGPRPEEIADRELEAAGLDLRPGPGEVAEVAVKWMLTRDDVQVPFDDGPEACGKWMLEQFGGLGVDAADLGVFMLEAAGRTVPDRHPETGRFQPATPEPSVLRPGDHIDQFGRVHRVDPLDAAAGRDGFEVHAEQHPLSPHSEVSRRDFEGMVRARGGVGDSWPAAAREVARNLAPKMGADELRAAGLLTDPAAR